MPYGTFTASGLPLSLPAPPASGKLDFAPFIPYIGRTMHKPVDPVAAELRSPLAAEVERRRTFAIISHPDAGKTTLTEKLLLFGGAINLAGQVKAKGERRNTRSDWMKIERERGISVVTSVMTFEYDGVVFNLLDTPGHEDFSEDTYRTLTAVDSAVMVIDAAKGIEARTRKLFEVCRLRDIPIITFINKMDRESRDPFDLLDEIEKTLALDTTPMTWPIGRGRDFVGTLDVDTGAVRLMDGTDRGTPRQMDAAALAALNPNLDAAALAEEFALVREACRPFDLTAFREGHLTPVFFGSALKNFGVGDLLDGFAAYAPPPRDQAADTRRVAAQEPRMTAFVFKIQANMDPNHRDRIAFARLCSGKLVRGMKAKHVRTGKAIGLHAPHFFFAQDRAIADEAYAGDVVGIPEPRQSAHRRHADRRRGPQLRRRAELRTGNHPPGPAHRCDEGEEAQAGAAGDGGGRRRPGVPSDRRLAGADRRRRSAAARRAARPLSTEYGLPVEFDQSEFAARAVDFLPRPQGLRHLHRGEPRRHRRGPRRRSRLSRAQPVLSRLHPRARAGDRLHRHQGREGGKAA